MVMPPIAKTGRLVRQTFGSIMWHLLFFVGVTGLCADLDEIAALRQHMTVGRTDVGSVETVHDSDSDLPPEKSPFTTSGHPSQGAPEYEVALVARPVPRLDGRPYQQSALATAFPVSPARLLSLRL